MGDTPRAKAGPADPATRKRMLKARLSEREPVGRYSAPDKAALPAEESHTSDLSVGGAVRKLKARKSRLDQAIEDAT